MKIVVGLGNPGKKYQGTRHNAGFLTVNKIAAHKVIAQVNQKLEFKESKKIKVLIAQTSKKGEKIILVKPQTFMNLSGQAVSGVMQYFKADIRDLIVISDDVDLRVGQARIRHGGSSGGHKGLQDIIDNLGSDQFARVRIGIASGNITGQESEKPKNRIDTSNFVLSKFSNRENLIIKKIINKAVKYIITYIGSKKEMPAHTIEIK